MRILERSLLYAACFAVSLSIPLSLRAQESQTKFTVSSGTATLVDVRAQVPKQSEQSAEEALPDSPGAEWARLQEPASQQASNPQNTQQSAQDQKPQRPAGTAAAEAPKVTGITAAEPAGVAIAPAKQRRVRIIVLKVGAIIGAGAAIGTVVALSAGTSSKPPGAH